MPPAAPAASAPGFLHRFAIEVREAVMRQFEARDARLDKLELALSVERESNKQLRRHFHDECERLALLARRVSRLDGKEFPG